MALAPWLNSNGAPVINAAGKPFLCETCPCAAPCSCPCETWPPEEWPCGGLAQTYAVSNSLASPRDGTPVLYWVVFWGKVNEYRAKSGCTASANVGESWRSCHWLIDKDGGYTQSRVYWPGGPLLQDWEDALPGFSDGPGLDRYFCEWRCQLSLYWYARKATGRTPAGKYFGSGTDYGAGFVLS